MPLGHMYECANPILCRNADIQHARIIDKTYNRCSEYAKYYMASYYYCKYNIDALRLTW